MVKSPQAHLNFRNRENKLPKLNNSWSVYMTLKEEMFCVLDHFTSQSKIFVGEWLRNV